MYVRLPSYIYIVSVRTYVRKYYVDMDNILIVLYKYYIYIAR